VVSDTERIVIHTNFTNTPKKLVELSLDDLLTAEGLRALRAVFFDPNFFKPGQTTEQVTEAAAAEFSRLAALLHRYGAEPQPIAHFLIRLLFVLFAEDVGLLPAGILKKLVDQTRRNTKDFSAVLRQLFAAMVKGGYFGAERIRFFNGGLFDSDVVLDLDSEALDILTRVDGLDWSSIEPSIFGTLFERSLDPGKRAQLGAHYTSKEDILLIVEPVLMAPLRRRWVDVQAEARALAEKRDEARGKPRERLQGALSTVLMDFGREIANVKVLDPACGSGNFLYVALRLLLDLEKSVNDFADELHAARFFPSVNVGQVMGLEINEYAYELAQTTIWIGFIQWYDQNGYGFPSEPILKPLHNIRRMDAILAYDAEGKPFEPEWPDADVIIGNPPFLGDKKMRAEMGDKVVDDLRQLYEGRVPGGADLVCYWFEKAREQIEHDKVRRAGLLSTNSIRTGANRRVLDRIKSVGDIFWAESDRSWILDGAAVRVSMVGFDNRQENVRLLDGRPVASINSDLSAQTDVTSALALLENSGLCFLGVMKGGPFDIEATTAKLMLAAPANPNGRPNSDVIKLRLGGQDVVKRSREGWIIDFVEMDLPEAALYQLPFEYVRENVKPLRDQNRDARMHAKWWLHGRSRPDMRRAISGLVRCIVTPEVSKYRLFIWMDTNTVPDHKLHVFARDDDYFFGVLQSRAHERWSLAQGSWMGVGNDPSYSSSRTFETFSFPFPPGLEFKDDPRIRAIGEAAAELVKLRDAWLNPPGASEAELKKRTLTNLYNQRPTWLDNAHRRLDEAVFAAYGWPADLNDDEILGRLLALNLERAGRQG
jgi:type II restriction/modification system DNA methylase subunit YeeA